MGRPWDSSQGLFKSSERRLKLDRWLAEGLEDYLTATITA